MLFVEFLRAGRSLRFAMRESKLQLWKTARIPPRIVQTAQTSWRPRRLAVSQSGLGGNLGM